VTAVDVVLDPSFGDSRTVATSSLRDALVRGAGGVVTLLDGGTYVIDQQVLIPAWTTIDGLGTATIKASDGIAWASGGLLRFGGAGITLRGLAIDGNRENLDLNLSRQLVAVLDADDATIERCRLVNSTGIGVYITTGLRASVLRCTFDEIDIFPVYAIAPAGTERSDLRIEGNDATNCGRGGIGVVGHHGASIKGNNVSGLLAVGMTCTFDGTTVTHTGGSADFGDLRVGNHLIHNAGGSFTESLIVSIESPTSCTISASVGGPHAGVLTAGGTGDLLSIEGCGYADVSENTVRLGVSIGIVHWVYSDQDARVVTIDRNRISDIGGPGINVQSSDSDTGTDDPDSAADYTVSGANVTNNIIRNVGQRGSAGNIPDFNVGIIIDEALGAIDHVWVDGNNVYDDQASPTTAYWLRTQSNTEAGDVSIGTNRSRGTINQGIAGGLSITLSEGWGSTAAVSSIVHHGREARFVVTAGGTGRAANPTISLAPKATSAGDPPMPVGAMVANSGGSLSLVATYDIVGSATPGSFAIQYVDTPGDGQIFAFVVRW
jgi:hypothetical protein